jgi:ribosome-binding protein aMBF1 (putative translation factor)
MRRTGKGRFRTTVDRLDTEAPAREPEPDDNLPGSPARIEEYARRVSRGEVVKSSRDRCGDDRRALEMRPGASPPGDQNATVGSARAGDVLGADDEQAIRARLDREDDQPWPEKKNRGAPRKVVAIATPFGRRLRGLREARGWTLGQLAYESGVSRNYLSELESGRRRSPRVGPLVALADALKVSLDELCGRRKVGA